MHNFILLKVESYPISSLYFTIAKIKLLSWVTVKYIWAIK